MRNYLVGSHLHKGDIVELLKVENLSNLNRLCLRDGGLLLDIVDTGEDIQINFIEDNKVLKPIILDYTQYYNLFTLMSAISEIGTDTLKQNVKVFKNLIPMCSCKL